MIETIELHLSNKCTANCVVCSKAHGGNNRHFADVKVLWEVVRQVNKMGNEPVIQFGGDGDAFMYPQFLSTLRMFKEESPGCHRCLYTNGYMLEGSIAERILFERLLDQIEIRIDSLDPEIYEKATGLELSHVLANIDYFERFNDHAAVCVLHLPLYRYRDLCKKVLGKEPTYWGRLQDVELKDEWEDIQRRFGGMDGPLGVRTRQTGISLWAERIDCEFSHYPCPRLPENWPGDMSRQIYVYPNGDIGFCGYDDAQCRFILGNVLEDKMVDVWKSQKATGFMMDVRNRSNGTHPYCCVNPKACVMWEFDNNGEPVDPADLHG